jgi:hypothetical protein
MIVIPTGAVIASRNLSSSFMTGPRESSHDRSQARDTDWKGCCESVQAALVIKQLFYDSQDRISPRHVFSAKLGPSGRSAS